MISAIYYEIHSFSGKSAADFESELKWHMNKGKEKELKNILDINIITISYPGFQI